MTRQEITYKLKQSGWTFQAIGSLWGVTKQYIYSLYWLEYEARQSENRDRCDLCGLHKPSVYKNDQQKARKLCGPCLRLVLKLS